MQTVGLTFSRSFQRWMHEGDATMALEVLVGWGSQGEARSFHAESASIFSGDTAVSFVL